MILDAFVKQPRELKDYDIRYTPWLEPMGDTLNDVEVIIECMDDPLDQTLILQNQGLTVDVAKIWLEGGTAGYKYKVTLIARTTGGRKDESELIVVIGDF